MDIPCESRPTEYSPHPASKFEEVRPTPGAWSANQNRNPNYAFTKTALVFKDKLDQIRGRNARIDTSVTAPTRKAEKPTVKIEELQMNPPPTAPSMPLLDRRVRILRVVQHTLLSLTSVAIAVLQSLTYIKWEQTKNVPDAWPQHPMLFPTLVLLIVAVMALLFDASSLVAYLFPTKPIAEKAYLFAIKLHYWITSLKTIAYTIAATICRAGFTMGGQQDLWGWSCSAQGQAMAATNDAGMNCTGNTVAWALSLLNISVEIIGVVITQMMESNKREANSRAMVGGKPNAANDDSAANPLLTKYGDLEDLGNDLHKDPLVAVT
ncbi:hypothetical protein E8E12_002377 [Didymella heteroderae]|uniref:Uncharacterized protein n=1 Tax=Didymella heteroderae TaxID=1769908 RepID=A0A9P4WIV3_9PLEO|nr:hypothetical protein E8E12_002377 [Didymella heteroderae]